MAIPDASDPSPLRGSPAGRPCLGAPALLLALAVGCAAPTNDANQLTVFLVPSPSSTAIQSFVPAFEEQTGITVHVTETPWGEAHQKLLLSSQQGRGAYDVAQFDNYFLAPLGAAGVMTPLDDYLARSEAYAIDDFSTGQQDYGRYAGLTLGLTLSTEPMIQWYRTDIYDALGLQPAATWEEYRANARIVHESGLGDGVILGWGPRVTWWWMTLVWSFGGHLYDDALVPTVNTPDVVAATTYLRGLLAYGPEGGLSASGDDVTNKFLSQDIGSMIQYSGYYGMTLAPANNKHVGRLGTAPMPRGVADITHLAGWNIGIPADSTRKDAAWRFLEFVLGKSNARDFLASGAAAVGRTSITDDPELLAAQPYLQHLHIPESSRIERYPQLTVWPEFEKAVAYTLPAILTGEVPVQEGLDGLQARLGPILAREKNR